MQLVERKDINIKDIPELSGVYCIINKCTQKRYIGSSLNLKRRLMQHYSYLRLNKHSNKLLQRNFNKYGEENINISFIKVFPKSVLLFEEQSNIDNYNTCVPNGLNLRPKAESNLGRIVSNETKEKLRISNTGKHPSEKTKEKFRQNNLGKKLSEETKTKIGIAFKIKVINIETKEIFNSLKEAAYFYAIKNYNLTRYLNGKTINKTNLRKYDAI